jgi:hypothetical protein
MRAGGVIAFPSGQASPVEGGNLALLRTSAIIWLFYIFKQSFKQIHCVSSWFAAVRTGLKNKQILACAMSEFS